MKIKHIILALIVLVVIGCDPEENIRNYYQLYPQEFTEFVDSVYPNRIDTITRIDTFVVPWDTVFPTYPDTIWQYDVIYVYDTIVKTDTIWEVLIDQSLGHNEVFPYRRAVYYKAFNQEINPYHRVVSNNDSLNLQLRVMNDLIRSYPNMRQMTQPVNWTHMQWECMGNPGERYMIYFTKYSPHGVQIKIPAGKYRCNWTHVWSGTVYEWFTIDDTIGNQYGFTKPIIYPPEFNDDVLLLIRKIDV